MLQTPVSSAPTFSLSRFVEDVRVVTPDHSHVDLLPDGRTSLIFRVLEEGRLGDLHVSGPRSHAHFKNVTDIPRVLVVRFKPGWSASLLGIAASALTDRVVALEDIWGCAGRDLCAQLVAAKNHSEAMDRIAHAIAARAEDSSEPSSARLARRAVRLLEGGAARVENVAAELGVTSRHLRRAFTESVGVGPKDFARTARLQRAVKMATASRDWGRIATDAGYYDQAHLISDFRELTGLTPRAFATRFE